MLQCSTSNPGWSGLKVHPPQNGVVLSLIYGERRSFEFDKALLDRGTMLANENKRAAWSLAVGMIAVLVNAGCANVQDPNNYRPPSQASTDPYIVKCSDRARRMDTISEDFYTCTQEISLRCKEAHDFRRWCGAESIRQRCRCQPPAQN